MANPQPIQPASDVTNDEPPSLSLPISPAARRLTDAEKAQYAKDGYVKNLPLFGAEAVRELKAQFDQLKARVPADIDINKINNWHKASRWVAGLTRTPALLDYVEDVLGPNFYHWAGQFFVKYPGDGSVVPWHQDSQYWPLTPFRTVTVWLAFYDADEQNGAMRVVKGSHLRGNFTHNENPNANYVLDQEVPDDSIEDENIVTLDLKAGEISLHDSRLLHGSLPNDSDRVRCGFTMRYCPTDVKCDLDVWPNFETYPGRGIDRFDLNPKGKYPHGESYPVTRFQHSSDFD